MKALRLMAGLSQDLVYHMGRHSFASLVTLEEGVPIETISKMLGHSNVRTTQIYARVSPKRLFEDMDRFIEATRDLKLILCGGKRVSRVSSRYFSISATASGSSLTRPR